MGPVRVHRRAAAPRTPGMRSLLALAVVCVAASRAAELPAKAPLRPGILMWSWGRCGTGTFWDTIRDTAEASGMQIEAVCGKKEGMSRSHLTAERFDECLQEIPASSAWFLHVKPKFMNDELGDSGAVIQAAIDRGAKVLLVIERSNWLARDVSGITKHWVTRLQQYGHEAIPRHCHQSHLIYNVNCPGNCIKQFEEYQREIDDAVMEGHRLGIRVVKVYFDHNNWPCPGMEELMKAAAEEGVFERMPNPPCVVHLTHTGDEKGDEWGIRHANDDVTLEERIGPCTAHAFERELNGTKYEWMLDVNADFAPQARPAMSGSEL